MWKNRNKREKECNKLNWKLILKEKKRKRENY